MNRTGRHITAAHLDIKPAAVASVGSQVTAVASQPTPTTPAVTPRAQDPVSMAVAQTLSARVSAITVYPAAASAITETRATMIKAMQRQLRTRGSGQ